MAYTKKSIGLSVLFLLIVVLLVWMAAGVSITRTSINTSGGNFNQGGGFLVYSTSGLITNGTSLTLNELPLNFEAATSPSLVNLSGFININLSILNLTAGVTLNVTNVTFSWVHNSNGSIMLNTTVSNLSSGAATGIFNHTFNTNTLAEGIYNISVYLHNFTLDPTNADTWPFNLSRAYGIAIDRTPPNVTSASLVMGNLSGYGTESSLYGYNFSAGLSEGNLSLQITVNDSTLTAQSVRFNVSNGSGPVVNVFNFTGPTSYSLFGIKNTTNYTSGWTNGSDGVVMGAFNLSRLAQGWYNLTVIANDTLNNRNTTVRMAFIIDRTVPSVSVTCSPSAATAGQTVTCTCTHTDAYPGSGLVAATAGFGTGTDTESTTATGSGSFTSSECRARDYAGNLATATGSWTVTAASTGGGGGGGSGGGIASGVVGNFEKKVWTSIEAGETATVSVRNSVLGVTEVSFSVEETTRGAVVEVKKVDSLPSTVESYSAPVYKTLQITEKNVEKALKGTATISFKVEKKWLTDNALSKGEVALHRYGDGKWNELTTSVKSDDDSYVYYAAQTPGFSYFMIAKKTAAAPAAERAAEEAAVPALEKPVEAPAETPAEKEVVLEKIKRGKAVWVVPVLVLLVVLGLLYWYWGRKK